jgi:ornithine cyclodeaminase/alanine dehydrogenase-like protein (mu-crystallin family)
MLIALTIGVGPKHQVAWTVENCVGAFTSAGEVIAVNRRARDESSRELLFLSRKDIEMVNLPIADTTSTLEEMFKEKGRGSLEVVPRSEVLLGNDAFNQALPAFLKHSGISGVKWVSVVPQNLKRALPRVTGLVILNDSNSGLPIAVMDAAWITARRTGATTALAAKYLARKESRALGILGCGVQGRSNLEGLHSVLNDLEEVRAYDISKRTLDDYVSSMSRKLGLKVQSVDNPREVFRNADVLVTAASRLRRPDPMIKPDWIIAGAFSCALDLDTYWANETMSSMDKFCTDDAGQALHYRSIGYLQSTPKIYADLGQIVDGQKAGRETETERTMFMNIGLALGDIAIAARLYEKAKRLGIGKWLRLD